MLQYDQVNKKRKRDKHRQTEREKKRAQRVRCNLFDLISFIVVHLLLLPFFCWRQNQLRNLNTIHLPTQCLPPLCAYATVRRHLNTTYDPNRLRFLLQISIAAAAQTTIVTPTDDIQRLDSNCASPASTSACFLCLSLFFSSPSASSFSSSSPAFPCFHFLPHLKCHCKCVWRLWLTFVCLLSLGLASVFLPISLPSRALTVAKLLSSCGTAKAKCW